MTIKHKNILSSTNKEVQIKLNSKSHPLEEQNQKF